VTQRWAYLGPEGTFTEQAVMELRAAESDDVELEPSFSVATAIADLRAGRVAGACVPIENSVEGAVPLTLDELTHGQPLMISAEAYVTVQLDLLVRPGTTLADIRKVGSHPHGHAQVRGFVTTTLPDAESVVFSSTAAAAAAVADGELEAAAAAPAAGRRYGLDSLAEDIGEVHGAVTRFVLLRLPGVPVPRTGNDKTSLVVYVQDEPGSLLAVLAELANRGINLTRLESRPARSAVGKYFFLLDADGHLDDPAMADAIAALHRRSAGLRFLGSYPRGIGTAHTPPAFASPAAFADASAFVKGLVTGAGQ
jgi:prephenate dehydratase